MLYMYICIYYYSMRIYIYIIISLFTRSKESWVMALIAVAISIISSTTISSTITYLPYSTLSANSVK